MKWLAAALAVALAPPALAQAPAPPVALPPPPPVPTDTLEHADGAPTPDAPPPPDIAIPGVDAPAAPAAGVAPPPAPEPPTGPVYLPTAPVRVAPHIERGRGYFGLGLGFGSADFAPRSFAGTGQALFALRAGKIFSDQILVGPEAVFSAQYDRWGEGVLVGTGLSSLMMQVMVFPVIDLPLNVATGLGWGSGIAISRLHKTSDGTPVVAEGRDGLSWMAGLGWDFFAGRGWNLGLQARYDGARFIGNGASSTRGFSGQIWLNSY